MTVTERKVLAEAWVAAAKPHALYVIVNVGTTVQSEAIDLAAHAASIGASAVAAVCFPTCQPQPALIRACCEQPLDVIALIPGHILGCGRSILFREMTHASSNGHSFVFSQVPPYYTTASNIAAVLQFIQPIAAAAPTTPFFYYHIPGLTRTELSVAEMLRVAAIEVRLLVVLLP
jgi:dihydrodipicolinate synthase/N-acetylneuraminate lyase